VGGRHVAEGGCGRALQGIAEAEDGHLDQLGAGGRVVGAEGAVGVAADRADAEQHAHRRVEVIARLDVGESWQAGGARGRGAGEGGGGGAGGGGGGGWWAGVGNSAGRGWWKAGCRWGARSGWAWGCGSRWAGG